MNQPTERERVCGVGGGKGGVGAVVRYLKKFVRVGLCHRLVKVKWEAEGITIKLTDRPSLTLVCRACARAELLFLRPFFKAPSVHSVACLTISSWSSRPEKAGN